MSRPRTVEEHRRVVETLVPDLGSVTLPLARAQGRVLAADLTAPIDLPPFDNSAMDGYALRAGDLVALPVTLPVSVDIPAGSMATEPLAPGTAARIMTGAPMPAGAEVIVPVELTDAGVHQVTIRSAPEPGVHLRRHGEDVRAGVRVLPAGTVLGATQLAVAAALGVAELTVIRPVEVLILSTGSELVAPGGALGPGQIFESNAVMLAASVRAIGGHARVLQFVPDDAAQFTAALSAALGGVDVVVTTGGVSAGAYEVVKDALTGQGVEFVKVSMQPGGPQGAGRFSDVPVVTFPGNPVSAYVSFEVFLRPVLLRAMGISRTTRTVVQVPLAETVDSPAGRRQFRRAVFDRDAHTVKPWGGPGSHLLSWLAGADSMLVLAEDETHLDPGDLVEVWLLE
ncbi:MAG: gephyrin-like molybdotransferase Glp [Nakamurella sp.]